MKSKILSILLTLALLTACAPTTMATATAVLPSPTPTAVPSPTVPPLPTDLQALEDVGYQINFENAAWIVKDPQGRAIGTAVPTAVPEQEMKWKISVDGKTLEVSMIPIKDEADSINKFVAEDDTGSQFLLSLDQANPGWQRSSGDMFEVDGQMWWWHDDTKVLEQVFAGWRDMPGINLDDPTVQQLLAGKSFKRFDGRNWNISGGVGSNEWRPEVAEKVHNMKYNDEGVDTNRGVMVTALLGKDLYVVVEGNNKWLVAPGVTVINEADGQKLVEFGMILGVENNGQFTSINGLSVTGVGKLFYPTSVSECVKLWQRNFNRGNDDSDKAGWMMADVSSFFFTDNVGGDEAARLQAQDMSVIHLNWVNGKLIDGVDGFNPGLLEESLISLARRGEFSPKDGEDSTASKLDASQIGVVGELANFGVIKSGEVPINP